MQPIFRVEQNPKAENQFQLLGFSWIEVMAIEPWALGNPGDEYGNWCYKTIKNLYICRTEVGIIRITSDDFWAAIEDYNEMVLNEMYSSAKDKYPLIITAGHNRHLS